METSYVNQGSNHTIVRLLNADQVAEILNVSRSHAYSLIQSGQIPSIRLGRAVRVRPQDLERFIAESVHSSMRIEE
jgi:excisionase family DNA binding protein